VRIPVLALLIVLVPAFADAQANGKLQIHQLNVGQGDATLIISPLGQTMLIDTGPTTASACASATGIVTYLISIGLTHLDYHVASHYHADHIGCTDRVQAIWPVQIAAYDRGLTDLPSTAIYLTYVTMRLDSREQRRQHGIDDGLVT
jgi:beta-lactamase superfamily II metal-dependent hydrolase